MYLNMLMPSIMFMLTPSMFIPMLNTFALNKTTSTHQYNRYNNHNHYYNQLQPLKKASASPLNLLPPGFFWVVLSYQNNFWQINMFFLRSGFDLKSKKIQIFSSFFTIKNIMLKTIFFLLFISLLFIYIF